MNDDVALLDRGLPRQIGSNSLDLGRNLVQGLADNDEIVERRVLRLNRFG
jgi:hypothetical protein